MGDGDVSNTYNNDNIGNDYEVDNVDNINNTDIDNNYENYNSNYQLFIHSVQKIYSSTHHYQDVMKW